MSDEKELESKPSRISILKQSKSLSNSLNESNPDTNNYCKENRRVSFASSNFVKPFTTDPEKNTIWDITYEEHVHSPDSDKSNNIESIDILNKTSSHILEIEKNADMYCSSISPSNNIANITMYDECEKENYISIINPVDIYPNSNLKNNTLQCSNYSIFQDDFVDKHIRNPLKDSQTIYNESDMQLTNVVSNTIEDRSCSKTAVVISTSKQPSIKECSVSDPICNIVKSVDYDESDMQLTNIVSSSFKYQSSETAVKSSSKQPSIKECPVSDPNCNIFKSVDYGDSDMQLTNILSDSIKDRSCFKKATKTVPKSTSRRSSIKEYSTLDPNSKIFKSVNYDESDMQLTNIVSNSFKYQSSETAVKSSSKQPSIKECSVSDPNCNIFKSIDYGDSDMQLTNILSNSIKDRSCFKKAIETVPKSTSRQSSIKEYSTLDPNSKIFNSVNYDESDMQLTNIVSNSIKDRSCFKKATKTVPKSTSRQSSIKEDSTLDPNSKIFKSVNYDDSDMQLTNIVSNSFKDQSSETAVKSSSKQPSIKECSVSNPNIFKSIDYGDSDMQLTNIISNTIKDLSKTVVNTAVKYTSKQPSMKECSASYPNCNISKSVNYDDSDMQLTTVISNEIIVTKGIENIQSCSVVSKNNLIFEDSNMELTTELSTKNIQTFHHIINKNNGENQEIINKENDLQCNSEIENISKPIILNPSHMQIETTLPIVIADSAHSKNGRSIKTDSTVRKNVDDRFINMDDSNMQLTTPISKLIIDRAHAFQHSEIGTNFKTDNKSINIDDSNMQLTTVFSNEISNNKCSTQETSNYMSTKSIVDTALKSVIMDQSDMQLTTGLSIDVINSIEASKGLKHATNLATNPTERQHTDINIQASNCLKNTNSVTTLADGQKIEHVASSTVEASLKSVIPSKSDMQLTTGLSIDVINSIEASKGLKHATNLATNPTERQHTDINIQNCLKNTNFVTTRADRQKIEHVASSTVEASLKSVIPNKSDMQLTSEKIINKIHASNCSKNITDSAVKSFGTVPTDNFKVDKATNFSKSAISGNLDMQLKSTFTVRESQSVDAADKIIVEIAALESIPISGGGVSEDGIQNLQRGSQLSAAVKNQAQGVSVKKGDEIQTHMLNYPEIHKPCIPQTSLNDLCILKNQSDHQLTNKKFDHCDTFNSYNSQDIPSDTPCYGNKSRYSKTNIVAQEQYEITTRSKREKPLSNDFPIVEVSSLGCNNVENSDIKNCTPFVTSLNSSILKDLRTNKIASEGTLSITSDCMEVSEFEDKHPCFSFNIYQSGTLVTNNNFKDDSKGENMETDFHPSQCKEDIQLTKTSDAITNDKMCVNEERNIVHSDVNYPKEELADNKQVDANLSTDQFSSVLDDKKYSIFDTSPVIIEDEDKSINTSYNLVENTYTVIKTDVSQITKRVLESRESEPSKLIQSLHHCMNLPKIPKIDTDLFKEIDDEDRKTELLLNKLFCPQILIDLEELDQLEEDFGSSTSRMSEEITSTDFSCNNTIGLSDVEIIRTLEERIKEAAQRSEPNWKFAEFKDNYYCFYAFFKTVPFKVKVHPETECVDLILTYTNLRDDAEPYVIYMCKYLREKLIKENLRPALGDNFNILTLLDYVSMCVEEVRNFSDEFNKLKAEYEHGHTFRMNPDLTITIEILHVKFVIWWIITLELSPIHLGQIIKVTATHRYEHVDEKCIQNIAKKISGSSQLRNFLILLDEYVEKEGKRILAQRENDLL